MSSIEIPDSKTFPCGHVGIKKTDGQLRYCRFCRRDGKDGWCEDEKHSGTASVGITPFMSKEAMREALAKQKADDLAGKPRIWCMTCERPIKP